MLIGFPLGLLATSVIFDIVYLVNQNATFVLVSYWTILAGIIGGLAAAVFGFWDWLTIPGGTRAKRVGGWPGVVNVVVVALFAGSWLLRHADPALIPSRAALVLSFAALGLALISGWLGGELVEKLAIGVAANAGPDAPSSLTDHAPDVQEDAPFGALGRPTP